MNAVKITAAVYNGISICAFEFEIHISLQFCFSQFNIYSFFFAAAASVTSSKLESGIELTFDTELMSVSSVMDERLKQTARQEAFQASTCSLTLVLSLV